MPNNFLLSLTACKVNKYTCMAWVTISVKNAFGTPVHKCLKGNSKFFSQSALKNRKSIIKLQQVSLQ